MQALACCYRPSRPVIKEDDARFSSSRCTDEAGHNALQKKKNVNQGKKKNTERKERRIRSREGSYTNKKKKKGEHNVAEANEATKDGVGEKRRKQLFFFFLSLLFYAVKKKNNNNKRLIEFHRSRNRMRRGAIGT